MKKQIEAKPIENIIINGNQIFNIFITTSNTTNISIASILDGEYQNDYQIVSKEENNQLTLSLELMSFENIADDKRNAHKVIAAELHLEIPEQLNLNIVSDVGSVNLDGNFKTVFVKLKQGYCNVKGLSKSAVINTIEGNIKVITKNAKISASSYKGKIMIDDFESPYFVWTLNSINGNITVVKP
ncbi:hypothetical protein [uncultured Winogradskyella sp.]|uniref:hypothetical protein n=1 Tax=uncultured Winogradskyella sp. TaxID=395353 RepID=UPI002602AF1A|nr:hypothetical protein [uncultured Winogradskyella sp.]